MFSGGPSFLPGAGSVCWCPVIAFTDISPNEFLRIFCRIFVLCFFLNNPKGYTNFGDMSVFKQTGPHSFGGQITVNVRF